MDGVEQSLGEPTTERLDQFIIFAGYGEVMYRLQTLEFSLWGLLASKLKSGLQQDQAFAKVDKWNATTFGELVRGVKTQGHWPDDLVDGLLHSVETRNYMAHHFLRDYFIAERPAENREAAAQELANIANWLDDLAERLDAHLRSVGVLDPNSLDDGTRELADSLRPKYWAEFMAGC